MKSYIKVLSLWEVVENDTDHTPFPQNPTRAFASKKILKAITELMVEGVFLAKTSFLKGKGRIHQFSHCKKPDHEEKDCWHKGKPQCFKCKRFGHLQKDCRVKHEEQAKMVEMVEEETLF